MLGREFFAGKKIEERLFRKRLLLKELGSLTDFLGGRKHGSVFALPLGGSYDRARKIQKQVRLLLEQAFPDELRRMSIAINCISMYHPLRMSTVTRSSAQFEMRAGRLFENVPLNPKRYEQMVRELNVLFESSTIYDRFERSVVVSWKSRESEKLFRLELNGFELLVRVY
ncbi:MAG: hypothetical protein ACYCOU_01580 [Sulfobacillus sp.]